MTDNSLNKYLDEIGREQLLSDEQERQLSERILQGDQWAVGRLVEANLRFVVKIATLYRGQGLQLDDLISEGNIGLMTAAAKFDARRGTRFVSYAAPYVRRQIERAIEEQNGIYKIPKDADRLVHQNGKPLSVDAPLGSRSNMSLLSVLVNQDSPHADERVYSEAVEHAVEFALLSLSERESQIINRFFGLDREHETMAEIAEDLDLKRERVRQIRNRAIRRLKKNYRHKLAELR
ncbi:MAG: sigma-70 family RNA polymerase sigma factor [Prevotella sp.]|nr:sigma-70 family RNA polymerase sigma factor [Prevotella sp.]